MNRKIKKDRNYLHLIITNVYILTIRNKLTVFNNKNNNRKMRVYQQQPFRGLPSNQPLKSPSPDLKGKNAIGPTISPQQISIRKSISQFTPNRAKKISYMNYSTLPVNTQQQHQSSIQTNKQTNLQHLGHEKQYSSTHAKGHYNFELPKQLIITNDERQQNDLISTGKKSTHKRNMTYSNFDSSPMHQTHTKFHREDDLMKTINQKDMIIHELKEMINLMTQNGKHLKNSQRTLIEEEYQSMKNEVRILTIENQKLAEVIQRLKQKSQKLAQKNKSQKSKIRNGSKQRSKTQENVEKSQRSSQQNLEIFKEYQEKLGLYEEEIESLKTRLEQKQARYQKEMDQMINSHKSLALQCKMYQNQKEQFSKQNQRLINLLRLKEKEKQTCYANYSYVDKRQYQLLDKKQYQSQQAPNTKPPVQLNKSESGRLSIQKIKAQYQQNLKQYKQNVYNQVYSMFDKISVTLEEINQKINGLDEKLKQIQKFRNSLKFKSSSHLTSLEQNQEQSIKKSAIYIQDPPSSQRISRESNNREALSVILQESARDNQKLQLQLSQLRKQVDNWRKTAQSGSQQNTHRDLPQVSQLRRQLEMWRKTAQQKSQENDQKEQNTYSQEQISSYQERIKQLQNLVDELRQQKETSEKEIMRLACEILKTEEEHVAQRNQLTAKLRQYQQSLRSQSVPDKAQMDRSLIQQLKSETQSLKQQIETRRQESMRLRQQIAQMEAAQQAKEKELLNQIQHFHFTIKETEENFKIQQKQNQSEKQQLLGEIDHINQLNRTQAGQIHSLQQELKTIQVKVHSLVQNIYNFQSKIQHLQHQAQQKSQTIISLQKQNQGFKKKLQTDSQKYLLQIHKFTSEFQIQVKQYIQDIESYKSQIKQYIEEIESCKSQIVTLKQQNSSYCQENENYQNEIHKYKEENQNLQKEKLGYLSEIQGNKREIQRLEHFMGKLTEQLRQKAELISILEEYRQALNVQKEKSIQTESKLNNLIKNIKKFESFYKQGDNLDLIKEYISQLEDQNWALSTEKSELITEIQSGKSQLFELENIRIQLSERVRSLESQMQLYKKQLQDTKNFYHNRLSNNRTKSIHQSEQLQPITHYSQFQVTNSKSSSKKTGRHRIYEIIDEEKHKISNLASIIDSLENQPFFEEPSFLQQEAA